MNRVHLKVSYHIAYADKLRSIILDTLNELECKLRHDNFELEYEVNEWHGRTFTREPDANSNP